MLFREVADTWAEVTRLGGRLLKVERLASLLARLEEDEVPLGVAYLSGYLPQGRIGVGHAVLARVLPVEPAPEPVLTVRAVSEALGEVEAARGAGSQERRELLLGRLFRAATRLEQEFLVRLLMGELRQGAQESLVLDAVARASGVAPERIRRAVMLRGEAGGVGRAVLEGGSGALAGDAVELFRAVKPMLAGSADGVFEALERMGTAAFEYKLDGARLQVHKEGGEVRVFTRSLSDETDALPEIVEAVRALSPRSLVVDGEAIALGKGGAPRPFQETMRRFGRKRDVTGLVKALPLTPFFFDVLYLDGEPTIDLPLSERHRVLSDVLPPGAMTPRIVTDSASAAEAFLVAALEAGHEGLVAKDLGAPYAAGRRGKAWLKIKPCLTADFVVLAAEWGHGRRQGWLSNLHLGARGEATGELVMVGKTFKGMTDDMLRWQTERLQDLATERTSWLVRVRPELLVEVAFDGVQASPRYPGGVALRFARVKGYREDKTPEEADTLAGLREILARST